MAETEKLRQHLNRRPGTRGYRAHTYQVRVSRQLSFRGIACAERLVYSSAEKKLRGPGGRGYSLPGHRVP